MPLHRIRRVHLVPLEVSADLVGGEVEGGVAFGAVELDVSQEGPGEAAQSVANQEAEVGRGEAAHGGVMGAAGRMGQAKMFSFCS